jgi:hypothetical protein
LSLFRLSRREGWWKDAEILIMRHQLAVALRERPRAPARLTWLWVPRISSVAVTNSVALLAVRP